MNTIDGLETELGQISPVMKALAQTDKESMGCGQCIRDQSRYCFVQLTNKEQGSIPVTTGQGKCCGANDFSSPGCDPIGVQSFQSDEKYKDYNINLVCSKRQDTSESRQYWGTPKDQPVVFDSSEPYEFCPHFADQCGGSNIIIGNNYT